MKALLARVSATIGLDTAIWFNVLNRFWSLISGAVALYLITSRLNVAEQGTYYTFGNILALQIFFEMGLGYVVMQVASHEMPHLTFGTDGKLKGDTSAKQRLAALLRKTVAVYAVIATAFLLVLMPVGIWFYSSATPDGVEWKGPWIVLVVFASLAIMANPLLSFLEGCGKVELIAKRRFAFAVIANVTAWLILLANGKLYFAASLYVTTVVLDLLWFWNSQKEWLFDLWHTHGPDAEIRWMKDIWPFQWRISLSWLSGFFIFQLFTPLVFKFAGADEAGRMGLLLQISNLISAIAITWVNTKAPYFGTLAAERNWKTLNGLFKKSLIQSTMLICFGYTMVFVALPFIERFFPKIYVRLYPPWVMLIIFLAFISQHIVSALAIFLRSHRKEPYLALSLTWAFLIACFATIGTIYYGSLGAVIAYCGINCLVVLPAAWAIYFKFKSREHASDV